MLEKTLLYSLVPLGAMVLGALLGLIFSPPARLVRASQHFAAGVVFAAVAQELLPPLTKHHVWSTLTMGFLLGVILMLGVDLMAQALEAKVERQKDAFPTGIVLGLGIDLLIDGLLLGMAFLVGTRGGQLITLAIGFETLFLGLTLIGTLTGRGVGKFLSFWIALVLGTFVPLGASIGEHSFAQMSLPVLHGVLAFGVAALMYLVTEELLKEAHKAPDTPGITLSFFIGFLLVLLI